MNIKDLLLRTDADLPVRTIDPQFDGLTPTTALSWLEQLGRRHNPRFVITPEARPAYLTAVRWLLAHETSEDTALKGLLIMGSTGSGKTLLVQLLWELSQGLGLQRPFRTRSDFRRTLRPLLWYPSHAGDHVAGFVSSDGGQFPKIGSPVLHIGDLGTEPASFQRYGTTASLADLICQRSDFGYRDAPMIVTTNLTPDGLRERYGDRTFSRLMGDCVRIVLTGRDHRTTTAPRSNE